MSCDMFYAYVKAPSCFRPSVQSSVSCRGGTALILDDHVGFVMENTALGRAFFLVRRFSPVSIIPQTLPSHTAPVLSTLCTGRVIKIPNENGQYTAYCRLHGSLIMKRLQWYGHPYSASRRLTLALGICSSSVLIVPHGDAMRTENWRIGHWGDPSYNTSIPWCGYKKK